MKMKFLKQIILLTSQFMRNERSDAERFLSPFLFAVTVLILFSFVFGAVNEVAQTKIFIGETLLTAFFALQISLSRAFEPDCADDAFGFMKAYPVFPAAFFISKLFVVTVMGSLIFYPTIILSTFFNHQSVLNIFSLDFFALTIFVLIGLSAIGVLLSALVLDVSARQILFPLLYYPLTVPVLLAAAMASFEIINNGKTFYQLLDNWFGLLIIFDVIYTTIGILLFGELMNAHSK